MRHSRIIRSLWSLLALASFLAAWSPLHESMHGATDAAACHESGVPAPSHAPKSSHDSSDCPLCYLTRVGLSVAEIDAPTLVQLRPATPDSVVVSDEAVVAATLPANRSRGPPCA